MELKFRAVYKGDKPNWLMFHQQEINNELFFVCDTDRAIKYPFYYPFIDKDWIVMQAFDYYDRDNNQLYEGDIIKIYCVASNLRIEKTYYLNNFNCYIDYQHQYFKLKQQLSKVYDTGYFISSKLIGNIYENKELLNE